MTLGRVRSRTLRGVEAVPVTVEVYFHNGIPGFVMSGLPEAAVRESRDRVKAAIVNSGYSYPDKKIIVNLAPADLPKQGGRFDLPIALAILIADGEIPAEAASDYEFIGELSLGGELRAVTGALPTALAVATAGHALILPSDNAGEAGLCETCGVYPAADLGSVVKHFVTSPVAAKSAQIASASSLQRYSSIAAPVAKTSVADMSEVKGQLQARRALEIAATGGHNLLFVGPPGTGKSMLASRLPGILPGMSIAEATETASVASISAKGFSMRQWRIRPFRSPHHTASGVALVGGGGNPKPGEISLAHNGVLFLDELPEFSRAVLDVLREPLEVGCVTISRAGRSADFPANFQLVAAMNPCPCGHDGDPEVRCKCTSDQVGRYQSRLSGPFLDRLDIQVGVPRMDPMLLNRESDAEKTEVIRQRVEQAYTSQQQRQGCVNARLDAGALDAVCGLSKEDTALLENASRKLRLSLRAYHRLLRVARSIADIEQQRNISAAHLLEAISYRQQFRA